MGVLNCDFVYCSYRHFPREDKENTVRMTFLREGSLCSLLAAYHTSEQTRPFSWSKTSVNYDWESPAYHSTIGKIIKW